MTGHENAGYRRMFDDGLSVGVFVTGSDDAAEESAGPAVEAEAYAELGFDALWVRDIPLHWPKFGETEQSLDPWTLLASLAAQTDEIALATGSVVLPLRHPLHVAKAAASIDRLSGGRLVLGVGTGDRPPEFEAFGVDEDDRGTRFRESIHLLRTVWRERFPETESRFGSLAGDLDAVPKPTTETLPLLVTGNARQSVEWIGEHGDGWLFYQLPRNTLASYLDDWRDATPEPKPFVQGLRVDLHPDPSAEMEHVHQGFRAGSDWFVDYFRDLEALGVGHVAASITGAEQDRRAAVMDFADDVLAEL